MENTVAQRPRMVNPEGFGGRAWLTVEEWETYRRRAAVRYPQKLRAEVIKRDGETCCICGSVNGKPIQLAHHVPFKMGLIDFGLTPEWLDSIDNLRLAHQGSCNDLAECKSEEVPQLLVSLGLNLKDSPVVRSGAATLEQVDGDNTVEFKFNV